MKKSTQIAVGSALSFLVGITAIYGIKNGHHEKFFYPKMPETRLEILKNLKPEKNLVVRLWDYWYDKDVKTYGERILYENGIRYQRSCNGKKLYFAFYDFESNILRIDQNLNGYAEESIRVENISEKDKISDVAPDCPKETNSK